MDVGPALLADVQVATQIEPGSVRFTTRRYRPRRSEDSMPRRAIRAAPFPSPLLLSRRERELKNDLLIRRQTAVAGVQHAEKCRAPSFLSLDRK
jgi:hypothetical protein